MAKSDPLSRARALVVELDPLLLDGFALSAETLDERLKKYGLAAGDPYRFVRQVYGKPFGEALAALLPATLDQAHVERRLAATYSALLQQRAQQVQATIRAIFRPLAAAGVRVAVVTRLRADIVAELTAGLPGEVLSIFDPSPLAVGLAPETLQAAVVALAVPRRDCRALVACGVSMRSAVRIGLRSAIVPSEMVAFEQCAGADWMAERLDRAFLRRLKAYLGAGA